MQALDINSTMKNAEKVDVTLSATSKLVKAWESKTNQRAMKAGGGLTMALTLAACGGSSDTTTTDDSAADANQDQNDVTTDGQAVTGDSSDTGTTPVEFSGMLSVGKDVLPADGADNSGDDTFLAYVVQNDNGEQTNELGTGDVLAGGDGADVLKAYVQEASPLNDGPSSSIMPFTTGIEKVHFTALDTTAATSGAVDVVELNAKQMLGLDEVGSVQSDASLTVYNVNTLTDSGDYSDRRLTEEVTIRMDHTGNGTENAVGVDMASDMTVLFDQNYLLKQGDVNSGSTMTIEIMDMDAALTTATSATPLLDNVFGEIVFTLGGESKTLTFGTEADTYAELLVDVQEALAADASLSTLTATLGADFDAADTDTDPGGTATGQTIVITNSGSEELEAVTMRAIADAPAGNDYHTNFESETGSDVGFHVTSNIVLNKVGRGSDGGDLVVGGMSTDGLNNFESGSGSSGVEKFVVTVEGDSSQPSDLASLHSTNNTLEIVDVNNATGSTASLTIGNSQTVSGEVFDSPAYNVGVDADAEDVDVSSNLNNAMKDVMTFDASGFANDLTLHAHFSDEVVSKYLNITDTDADPTADNEAAVYTTAAGDDTVNVNLAKANMAVVGTETREDFSFTASTGAGNDLVQLQIGDGIGAAITDSSSPAQTNDVLVFDGSSGEQTVQNWYLNHVINQNMNVDAGAGSDKVETWGSTAATIDLGAGDDVAFTDNSAEDNAVYNDAKAVWVQNALNVDVDDLQSRDPASVANVANLQVTVAFQGIESTAVVGNSDGSIDGVTITDLVMNQAIKDAINNDSVLSELLVAEDGPAGTLVVRSLVDGEHAATDLSFTLSNTEALATAQTAGDAMLWTGVDAAVTGTPVADFAFATRYASTFGEDSGATISGIDSVNINTNNVEGNTGDDIIVLSTNGVGDGIGDETGLGTSTETVHINAAFGDDTVLNFTAAGLSASYVQAVTYTALVPETSADAGETLVLTANGVETVISDIAIIGAADGKALATAVAGAFDGVDLDGDGIADEATASDDGVTITFSSANVADEGDVKLEATGSGDLAVGGETVKTTVTQDGIDVFDVETVIGGAVETVINDTAGAEAKVIGDANLDARNVIIIDEIGATEDEDEDDTDEGELAELQGVITADDATASANADDSIIITVDADNVGTFYLVDNGTAAADAVVSLLGSVELGEYADFDKTLIGDWDAMTIANFDNLNVSQLTNTFDIA